MKIIHVFWQSVPFKVPNQIVRMMKLTAIILTTLLLQVSASSIAQKVTLNKKNLTLKTILKEISRQTGYNILWSSVKLNDKKRMDVNLTDKPLEEALNKVLSNEPFTYTIKDKTIVISEKRSSFLDRISNTFLGHTKEIDVRGRVIDEKGQPLAGASVRVKKTNKVTLTNNQGYFQLQGVPDTAILMISYIGYRTKEVAAYQAEPIVVTLEVETSILEDVNIVSTGYQRLPKERATGSFEKINNNLFNRVTGTDVISRLSGTVPGIYFDNANTLRQMTIRGISTLSNEFASPLIVLDNIPYEGDINNINPNDIESVTVLKDAAAASIWGTRAGNGVIVLTTKKGKYNKPLQVSINTNYTVIRKPDLFYAPQISSSDFIEVEKFLFNNGFYQEKLTQTDPFVPFVTPVVYLLNKQNQLPLNDLQGRAEIDNQINAMKNYDVRNDYLKHVYRNQRNQQYAINLNGGSNDITYFMSAGFDKNLNNTIKSDNQRLNLRSSLDYRPFKNLEIQTAILYTDSRTNNIAGSGILGYKQGLLTGTYPYARLADDNGNPMFVGITYGTDYLNSLATNPKLLDWRYKPLEDIKKSRSLGRSQDILLNTGAKYIFNPVVSFEVKYQYQRSNLNSELIYQADSYYARDLINRYTSPANYQNPVTFADASYIRSIPVGGMYNAGYSLNTNQTIRGQINLDKTWGDKHQISAIAGGEIRKINATDYGGDWRYGYNPTLKTFQTLNYQNINSDNNAFPLFYGGESIVPLGSTLDDNYNRFTSYFANASYTFDNRYVLSASARKDASNVFGVNANKRGAPLWSAGIAWNISNESFYKSSVLPYLKFRATYGYSGTTIPGVPAFSVIAHDINPTTLYPFVRTLNLPNPDLRWEKTGLLNLGLDFSSKDSRISGSIEYFDKRSKDLLARSPLDPTTGYAEQTFNTANLNGKGVDIELNSTNLRTGNFEWTSNLIFSYNKIIVSKYLLRPSSTSFYLYAVGINPVEGQDAYVLYALPSAGLDPQTGDPRGYLNGQVSNDYLAISRGSISTFRNMGSSRPRYYGNFRNTFSYKQLSLSASVFYKLGYVFRRDGLGYVNLFYGNTGNSEFTKRWQKPGDENHTYVPSMVYPPNSDRDNFYQYSDVLVEKGDHIRLQDVTASYSFNKIKGFKSLRLYGNLSNLGIIWKANKKHLDPEAVVGYPNPLTVAFGLNATF